MRDPARKVGIGRLVRLAWLEETASLVAAGNDKTAVHGALDRLLTDQISLGGNAPRSGREKAITVLMKTWLLVPDGLEPLRDDGLRLLNQVGKGERIALHWGMLLAAYPFWGAVAARTGRLLRIEGRAGAAQVQQRIREEYGERPGVERAARYVLRSFVDWGILAETGKQGTYSSAPPRAVRNPGLVAWLSEAVLLSRFVTAASPRVLLRGPRLFPFHLPTPTGESLTSHSTRLDFVRHGLDEQLVMLVSDSTAPQDHGNPRRLAFGPTRGPEPT